MPERQCVGCKRQTQWGCEAVRYPSTKEDPAAKPERDGNWWGWMKPASLPLNIDGEDTYACPRQDLKANGPSWSRMLMFYGLYKKGHLPEVGAVIDQSNKAMQVFRALDDANHECDVAIDERDRAKRNQDGPRKGRP